MSEIVTTGFRLAKNVFQAGARCGRLRSCGPAQEVAARSDARVFLSAPYL
ncbi:hypothetical protein CLV89_10210 [Tritonibacter scottomollicae]|uniref:Uncharacterized protein n=1 Tax=Tritonibacter scottomollicae TaxID=483013 RepID=A0A2T1AKY1_TRISK|nr:hypothetical protein CLV89_10210 [Tritonibacter scottomollicae]